MLKNFILVCQVEDYYIMSKKKLLKKNIPQLSFKEGDIIKYSDFQFDYGYQCFIFSRSMIEKNKLTFPLYTRFQRSTFFL